MNAQEAELARVAGEKTTADNWILAIQTAWSKHLSEGRRHMWVNPDLQKQTEEVQARVVNHFRKLGYYLEIEVWNDWYTDYVQYCLRIEPKKPEPGIFRKFISRIFGGSA